MNNIRTVISLAIGALYLTGCSTIESNALVQTLIKPIQQVRHGTGTDDLYRMAKAFQSDGRLAEAITAYRQVIQADPRHAEAHNALGVIYSQQQQVELAEQQFQLALQIDPNLAHVHNNIGYHLLRNGRLQEALQALGRAHTLDRNNAAVSANIAAAQQAVDLKEQSRPEILAAAERPAPAPSADTPPSAPPSADTHALDEPTGTTSTLQLVSVNSSIWELKARVRTAPEAVTATAAAAPAATEVPASSQAETPAIIHLAQADTASMSHQATHNPYVTTLPARVEIANGNGTTGLALKLSRELMAQAGVNRPRLTNHKPFDVRTTRIQYVAGAESAARQLNASLPKPVPMVRVSSLSRDTTVRLLLGKDFPRQRAWAQDEADAAREASVQHKDPQA